MKIKISQLRKIIKEEIKRLSKISDDVDEGHSPDADIKRAQPDHELDKDDKEQRWDI